MDTVFPKISLVTPCYNAGKYLGEAIESVLCQGYPNLEYIVIDGGSNDNSVAIIKEHKAHLTYWASEPDQGMYHALSKGFEKSTGEIMGWINADDVLMPNSLFLLADLFTKHPQSEWIQGQPLLLSEKGYVVRSRPHYGIEFDYLLKRYRGPIDFIQQESTFWKRSLWKRAGGYISTDYPLAGDFELWMRFFQFGELYNAPGLIGAFRKHGNQLSDNKKEYLKECDEIIDHVKTSISENKQRNLKAYHMLIQLDQIPLIRRLYQRKRKAYALKFIQ